MPLLPRLGHRRRLPELMDDPSLDEGWHHQALRGLSKLNRLTRIARLVWPPLAELSRQLGRPPRVLDVATGAGDIPLALLRIARRHGAALNLSGCDISPRAIEFARRQTEARRRGDRFFPMRCVERPIARRIRRRDLHVISSSLERRRGHGAHAENGGGGRPIGRGLRSGTIEGRLVADVRWHAIADTLARGSRRRPAFGASGIHGRRDPLASGCKQD